jgi:hypothetical protein
LKNDPAAARRLFCPPFNKMVAMKKLLLLLGFAGLCFTTVNAQTSTAGNTPGINPGASAVTPNVPFATPSGLPGSAANNGLPAGPVNPGLPGFTNILGPFFTNQLGSNVVGDLAPVLLNLQASLAQALPAVAAFNNNFEIGNGGAFGGTNGGFVTASNSSGTVTAPAGTPTGNNLSTLNSSSFGTSFATSAGQNLATVVGGVPRTTTTTGPNGTTTTATTTTTTGGVPGNGLPGASSTTGSSVALTGLFGTNAVGFANSRDAFRALIVLQADVERMLPLVAALNGVSPGAFVGGIGATNNVSGFPFTTSATRGNSTTTTTRQTGVNSLSPTGR